MVFHRSRHSGFRAPADFAIPPVLQGFPTIFRGPAHFLSFRGFPTIFRGPAHFLSFRGFPNIFRGPANFLSFRASPPIFCGGAHFRRGLAVSQVLAVLQGLAVSRGLAFTQVAVFGTWTRTTLWTLPPSLLPIGWLGPLLLLLGWRLGLSSLLRPRWFCGFCPCMALPLRSGIYMMPPLTRMGGSWLRLRRFSPTMVIRSCTTPVQIWRSIVGPGVWFRPSSSSIACRIISFLQGWSF